MEIFPRITVNPKQCAGKACIRDHRLTVEHVLKLLADGATTESLLKEWPFLEKEDIHAVLSYASHLAGERHIAVAS